MKGGENPVRKPIKIFTNLYKKCKVTYRTKTRKGVVK
jgi:hypothetical protein